MEDGTPFKAPSQFDTVEINNLIYLIGGSPNFFDVLDETWEFSFFRKRFRNRARLIVARKELAADEIKGVIYCVGGRGDNIFLTDCEMYNPSQQLDPKEDKWNKLPSLNFPRCFTSLCPIRNELNPLLYVFGGAGYGDKPLPVEFLTLTAPVKWEILEIEGEMPKRFACGILYVENFAGVESGLLIFGGNAQRKDWDDTFILDLAGEKKIFKWLENTKLKAPISFYHHKPKLMNNGQDIYIPGTYEIHHLNLKTQVWDYITEDEWMKFPLDDFGRR